MGLYGTGQALKSATLDAVNLPLFCPYLVAQGMYLTLLLTQEELRLSTESLDTIAVLKFLCPVGGSRSSRCYSLRRGPEFSGPKESKDSELFVAVHTCLWL
jgi:hypothetical protein